MKYKVYPEGYDPRVAASICPEEMIKLGLRWTDEDTCRNRELETQFVIMDVDDPKQIPINRWYVQHIEEDDQEWQNKAEQ